MDNIIEDQTAMDRKIESILELADKANGLLSLYIEVHDHIFKSLIRKLIPILGIFQKINYHSSFSKLSDIESELLAVGRDLNALIKNSDDIIIENKFIVIFPIYCQALLNTVICLKSICFKMKEKIDGNLLYRYSTYNADIEDYNNLVKKYVSYGASLNQYYKELVNKRR